MATITTKVQTESGTTEEIPKSLNGKNVRQVLADAFVFVRSMEVNKAISAVTIEQLMQDQIKRNGDSESSNKTKYDPYSYDPDKVQPAGYKPIDMANFLGVADTTRPTKLDRILALKNSVGDMVDQLKKLDPLKVADAEEYANGMAEATSEEL